MNEDEVTVIYIYRRSSVQQKIDKIHLKFPELGLEDTLYLFVQMEVANCASLLGYGSCSWCHALACRVILLSQINC